MSLQLSIDRLRDHTEVAPANLADHETVGDRIYLVHAHRARISQQAVNILSEVPKPMDHFGGRWIADLNLDCDTHRVRHIVKRRKLSDTSREACRFQQRGAYRQPRK